MHLIPATDTDKLRDLRRMKRIPVLLLVLMALLFAVTLHHPAAWAGWLHAFAEAGMVGALADWFAVVALFRHPLGIPIPHTAIIPSRKDRIGENLARFIAEHFLHPDVVRARLASVNLAGTAAKWLKSPSGEAKAIDLATRLARSALDALGEDEVRRFLNPGLSIDGLLLTMLMFYMICATLIISTHILEEVHALCNRAMIIADGRLLVDDTPAGLIARSRYHDAVTLVVEQPERVASTLSELPQARKVELREGELTVFPAPGARLFEAVSDAVRDNGWAVSELRLEAGRLDEVFRQVTRGEAA